MNTHPLWLFDRSSQSRHCLNLGTNKLGDFKSAIEHILDKRGITFNLRMRDEIPMCIKRVLYLVGMAHELQLLHYLGRLVDIQNNARGTHAEELTAFRYFETLERNDTRVRGCDWSCAMRKGGWRQCGGETYRNSSPNSAYSLEYISGNAFAFPHLEYHILAVFGN